MKNTIKWFGIIAIVSIIGFSMAACVGNSPKGLAKQMSKLEIQDLSTDEYWPEYYEKKAKLEKKVSKLSEYDYIIYSDEYERLMDVYFGY